MKVQKLYDKLGMNHKLFSKAPEAEPFFDSIRYIKIDSEDKASIMESIIETLFNKEFNTLVIGAMKSFPSKKIMYLRYHEEKEQFFITSHEIIKSNGYAGCTCSPLEFIKEHERRELNVENME